MVHAARLFESARMGRVAIGALGEIRDAAVEGRSKSKPLRKRDIDALDLALRSLQACNEQVNVGAGQLGGSCAAVAFNAKTRAMQKLGSACRQATDALKAFQSREFEPLCFGVGADEDERSTSNPKKRLPPRKTRFVKKARISKEGNDRSALPVVPPPANGIEYLPPEAAKILADVPKGVNALAKHWVDMKLVPIISIGRLKGLKSQHMKGGYISPTWGRTGRPTEYATPHEVEQIWRNRTERGLTLQSSEMSDELYKLAIEKAKMRGLAISSVRKPGANCVNAAMAMGAMNPKAVIRNQSAARNETRDIAENSALASASFCAAARRPAQNPPKRPGDRLCAK